MPFPPPSDRRANLRRSEDRLYYYTVNTSAIGMAAVDLEGRFQAVNPSLCQLLGYSSDEMRQLSIRDITHPDDLQLSQDHFHRTLAGEFNSYHLEKRYRHRDGTDIWVLLNVTLVYDETQQPLYFNAQLQDISERKRIKAELAAQNQFNTAILNSLALQIAILDIDGTIVDANNAWQQFAVHTGIADEWTGIGKNYLEMCRHVPIRTLPAEVEQGIRDVLSGSVASFEREYAAPPPHQMVWFRLRAAPLRDQRGRIVISLDDISNLKRTETQLRTSRRQLQDVLNNSPALIGYWNSDLRLVFANPAYQEWLGINPDEAVGKCLQEVLPPSLYDQNIDHIKQALRGETQEFERDLPPVHGNPARRALFRYIPDIQNHQVIGFYVHVADMTNAMLAREKRHEDQKQQEATRSRRLELQRDAVIREVHHRIKNHLQGIIGLIQDRVRMMPDIAPQLRETIHQVKTIAEVYGLQGSNNKGDVPLIQLMDMAARSAMSGKPVQCQFSERAKSVIVSQTDAVPLALLINELLTNAINHSDPSGHLRPVRLSLEVEGGISRLEIRNGPAMLPPGFSLSDPSRLGTGLELAQTLMPPKGAALNLRQDGDEVVAEMTLTHL